MSTTLMVWDRQRGLQMKDPRQIANQIALNHVSSGCTKSMCKNVLDNK